MGNRRRGSEPGHRSLQRRHAKNLCDLGGWPQGLCLRQHLADSRCAVLRERERKDRSCSKSDRAPGPRAGSLRATSVPS